MDVESTPEFVTVANGDIALEVAVAGAGPLILCIHGWPESWYSWRHQIAYFAARGYRVAAMNVRGYGNSSNPPAIEAYTLRELCGDAAAVIDALGDGAAIVFGHDWGAPIAWNTARLHPDRVRAVCGLSVPYHPVGPDDPLARWRELYTDRGRFFYQVYIADNVGDAEAELAADPLVSLRKLYYGASGEARAAGLAAHAPVDGGLLAGRVDPDPFPGWLSDDDLQVYADAFERSGWHGPLNRYRAQPLDAADIGRLDDPDLAQPTAFIGGEFDVVRRFVEGVDPYEFAGAACTDFRGTTIVDGAGHWVQQEAPAATNAALDRFVTSLTG